MAWSKTLVLPFAGLCLQLATVAAEHGNHVEAAPQQGLPSAAPVIFHIGPLPVSNSMILTWVVSLLLVLAVRLGVRTMKDIPDGAQNFWEWVVEGLYDFLGGIIGADLVHKTFWFFASLFVFVVATNWFGLLPGVGTIGYGVAGEHGFHVTDPLLRGANADFNMTFAMSMVFFVLWTVWALQANGPMGFLKHIFGAKGGLSGYGDRPHGRLLCCRSPGGCVHTFPPRFAELSPFRQCLRWREYAGVDDSSGWRPTGLAHRFAILLHGTLGRFGAGSGLHAPDSGFHSAHLLTR